MITKLIHSWLMYSQIESDPLYSYEIFFPGTLTSELLKEINGFHKAQYQIKSPYLVEKDQELLDERLNITDQSYFILARTKIEGHLVGTLRLKSFPLEIAELIKSNKIDFSHYKNHLEVSRLVVSPTTRNVGKKIMIFAGIHTYQTTSYKGYIGVCKKEMIAYFENFGMFAVSPVINLNHRPNDYYIIASNFEKMTQMVLMSTVKRLNRNMIKKLATSLKKRRYKI